MTAILLGLLAALAWGTADFAARFSGRALGAIPALFAVMAAGVVAVGLVLMGQGEPLPTRLSGWAALYGLAMVTGALCLYEGLRRGRVSVVAPLAGAFPAWSLAFLVAFGDLRPAPAAWAAMAAVMIGVWIVARFAAETAEAPEGRGTVLLGLGSGLLFGLALAVGPLAAAEHGESQAVWLGRLIGALVLLLPAWRQRRGAAPAPRRWWVLAALQGLLDTMALLAVMKAGAGPDGAAAMVVSSTFGIVTIALARVVLREAVAPLQWAGMALTFGGVAALTAVG